MIVDLLMIKTRIMWPNAAHIKECAEDLREVQSDTGPDQMTINDTTSGKVLVSGTTCRPEETIMKPKFMIIMIMNSEFI
jgi:hypothetical protein